MKRIFIVASLFTLIAGMSSCKSSGSFENDVTKMGNYQCKVQKLMAQDQNDEKVKKEMRIAMTFILFNGNTKVSTK